MSAATLFLLAVSLSMDAFAVAVCGGLKMPGKKRFWGGIIFGLWFGGFQALMPFLGYELGSHFARAATAYSHWIILIILSYIGINMIQEASEDEDKTPGTDFMTMLGLSLATSLDALGVCFYGHRNPVYGTGNRNRDLLSVLFGLRPGQRDRHVGQSPCRTGWGIGSGPFGR